MVLWMESKQAGQCCFHYTSGVGMAIGKIAGAWNLVMMTLEAYGLDHLVLCLTKGIPTSLLTGFVGGNIA